MTSGSASGFHARARFEAARYGADAWVFVRELVQNARDAGARRVWFETSSSGGRDRIGCRDDGSGMTFSHARDYLFTLYASSKKDGKQSAGRFGIGFWSILRFGPDAVTICSRPRQNDGWQVRLDGDLNVVQQGTVAIDPGTEIVIEREANGDDIENLVQAAILRDAPFVTRLGDPDRPIDVRVNGNRVRARFDLPSPSLSFSRRGLRGVVGLGIEPRVEIFAHGLRVRDAASLDDLLLTGRRGRPALSTASGGLAPRALMDSSRLTVLLARGDAREDRSLRRLVAVGHGEVRRLVRAELDRHARPSRAALAVEWISGLWSRSGRLPVVGLLLFLGAVAGWWFFTAGAGLKLDYDRPRPSESASSIFASAPRPYTDLGGSYRGPVADVLRSSSPVVDLGYRPALEFPHFAALLITGIDPSGEPSHPDSFGSVTVGGVPCAVGCLEVEMTVADGAGILRVPVATGHSLDPVSVRLNGEPLALAESVGGLPAVDLGGGRGGRLTYRSGRAPGRPPDRGGSWPPLPREAAGVCAKIAGLPIDERAGAAAEWVRRRVVYDTSPETARRHRDEKLRGRGLFERSLLVGAGDCDIQNALVSAMLAEVGIPSRLAVGWVGEAGRARPGLHAWVEYLGPDERWRVADASIGSGPSSPESGTRGDAATPSGHDFERDLGTFAGAAVALLLVGSIFWLRRNAVRRSFDPGERDGTADLVRAAAVHPESFVGIHALYRRRLIPVLDGRPISMARALTAAGRGALAVGGRGSTLALRAAVRGTVIDGETSVGAAAADALGALDLDVWHQLLSRSWDDPVATRVGRALTSAGEPFRLQIAPEVGEDLAVFDGARVGLSSRERWLLLDSTARFWQTACDLGRSSPGAAALYLADFVVDRLGLSRPCRDLCLAELARAALDERNGGRM